MAQKKQQLVIKGTVFLGVGQGSFFTQLDWVKEQFAQKIGFVPYPGTLNVRVSGPDQQALHALREKEGIILQPPDPQFCAARSYKVAIANVPGAIVYPLVADYPADWVEIMAPVHLKSTLGIQDGDQVSITIV